ncbi:MAG: type II toxin-antitoxin system YafQ family toxin [Minisyncoccia bacterium]
MYLIQRSKDFEKSFSKIKRSGVNKKVLDNIALVIDMPAHGEILDKKYRDHKLQGNYTGYRECHIRADLLLVYEVRETTLVLVLIDVGTHYQLGRRVSKLQQGSGFLSDAHIRLSDFRLLTDAC